MNACLVLAGRTSLLWCCRGYTRKEPFANGIWTPKAENWNGRTAMMGFTGIVLTEALAGKSVLEVSCLYLYVLL